MTDDTRHPTIASQVECSAVLDILGAYALTMLDPDEQAMVDAHLATCPTCPLALRRYETAMAALGSVVPPVAPPPELRSRLLHDAGIEERSVATRAVAPAAPPAPVPIRPDGVIVSRRSLVLLGLAAALLLVGIGVTGTLLSRTMMERDDARAERQDLQAYLAAIGDLMSDGGSVTPMALAGPPGDATHRQYGSLVVTDDRDQAMVIVSGLAALEPGQRYRVWLARGNERTPLDDLWLEPGGFGWLTLTSPEPFASYDTVGITLVSETSDARQDLLLVDIPSGVTS